MNLNEYKQRKIDKLTRDILQMVNKVPSFGYGNDIDTAAKIALSNYFITVVRSIDNSNVDIEIFTQSMSDEVANITTSLIQKMQSYKNDIQSVYEQE